VSFLRRDSGKRSDSQRAHACMTQLRKRRPPSLARLCRLCKFHLVIASCREGRGRGNSVAHPPTTSAPLAPFCLVDLGNGLGTQ
jgi:hypothetical protein